MNDNQTFVEKDQQIKMSYIKIANGNVIYPATITKRILARLLDFIFASIIPFILTAIYYANFSENEFIDPYNSQIMIELSVSFASFAFFFILIPLLNFKNLGQSFGKKILKITPLYFKEKNNAWSFIIRESFIGILLILPTLFFLIVGFNPTISISLYSNLYDSNPALNKIFLDQDFNEYGRSANGQIDFLVHIWADGFYVKDVSNHQYIIESWQVGLGILGLVIGYLFFISIIIVWVSAGVNNQKRGFHDNLAKTAIVDLKTITTEKYALDNYNKLLNVYKIDPEQEQKINDNDLNKEQFPPINDLAKKDEKKKDYPEKKDEKKKEKDKDTNNDKKSIP
ncbi:MAG: hypothetical protein HPPSJP_0560 [Candidatus Hepatoplasma scabrum]|nr:MAG: hypothetical protein HPPSJP_0560 [Candidatus Hepatoplasma sp.]